MVQYGLPTSQYYHHLSCQPGEGDVTGVVLIMTFHYHLIQYYHHLTFTPEEECVLGVVLPTSQLITWCVHSEESMQHGVAVIVPSQCFLAAVY